MSGKERLVLETDATRKSKLQSILRERGVTVSDWFEEQLDLLLTESDEPHYVTSEGSVVGSPSEVRQELESTDWAFADADTSYLSHDIHPYPAKFIPQIPSKAIQLLSSRGELVLDPFGGSGTTALEALRMGRRAVSIDANPLSALVGRVKTARIDEGVKTALRGVRAFLNTQLRDLPSSPHALLEEYGEWIPDVPNLRKWFAPESTAELAMVRMAVDRLEGAARDIAMLALSRIVVSASFQDSETRYASKPRDVEPGVTLRMYLATLDAVGRRVEQTAPLIRYGVADFRTADSRELRTSLLPDESVDLVVTSPPYGNATDYHLYHRFRLFWLGEDPVALGRIEIGSHLRHQREKTGFPDYVEDLVPCMEGIWRVLKPGRYAFIVVGDSVYKGETFDTAERLADMSEGLGFDRTALVPRPLPKDRRSFSAVARRATEENLLVMRKPQAGKRVVILPARYRLWPYEETLRKREATEFVESSQLDDTGDISLPSGEDRRARRLAFSRGIRYPRGFVEPTWQHILENGYVTTSASRKDPKYVTHGLHAYKGKFYPQLAKSLLNVARIEEGCTVLDPFCGSGTTLLESRLNGLRALGCDLNPLAAKIARVKVGVLDVDPTLLLDSVAALQAGLSEGGGDGNYRDFVALPTEVHDEMLSWFAEPIALKIDRILTVIRSCSGGIAREFLEVILSNILREVSHQEPRDLRIRRRKTPLEDADVFGLYLSTVAEQVERLEHFWEIRGYSPFTFPVAEVTHGDSREPSAIIRCGATDGSVDCVLTSPPYATALPYVDTDRLSLLVLFGMTSSERRPLENDLTGSREILVSERRRLEEELDGQQTCGKLPDAVIEFISQLLKRVKTTDAGFRKRNKPSLLLRFFRDMQRVLENCERALRPGGEMIIVVGDNTTKVGGETIRIPTTDFIRDIAVALGFESSDEFGIDVTTENLKHIKHAIKSNQVYRLAKPGS